MILPIVKENINKIDFALKQLFENVYISDKTYKNQFLFNITCNKMFLFEGCKKRIEVLVEINKENLKSNIISWKYSTNPLNENADWIERISNIETIANDIYDVASNKRMVNEYFTSLESHVDLINETTEVEIKDVDNKQFLLESVAKYSNGFSYVINEKDITFELNEDLTMSNKFRLENALIASGRINSVSFDSKTIKVNF